MIFKKAPKVFNFNNVEKDDFGIQTSEYKEFYP